MLKIVKNYFSFSFAGVFIDHLRGLYDGVWSIKSFSWFLFQVKKLH